MMPVRIQRKRTKGWRMPADTVSVTRPGRWGNPYFPGSGVGYVHFDAEMRIVYRDVRLPEVQVAWFRLRMDEMRRDEPERFDALMAPLRGKSLACWCSPCSPCHADVLLVMANAPVCEAVA